MPLETTAQLLKRSSSWEHSCFCSSRKPLKRLLVAYILNDLSLVSWAHRWRTKLQEIRAQAQIVRMDSLKHQMSPHFYISAWRLEFHLPSMSGSFSVSAEACELIVNTLQPHTDIARSRFNPVVSLALYLVGAVKGVRAMLCFVAHILGGISAAAVASAILPGALNVDTALGGNTTTARGLFLEMFLTAELVLAILFLAAEKHKATFLAPIGIGLALFIAELCGKHFNTLALFTCLISNRCLLDWRLAQSRP